jgi:hypothetical protein
MRARLLSVALLIFAAACASAGGTTGGGNANLLTAQDIQTNAISQGEPLYNTIERVRPQWLSVRAGQPQPTVFIDGANAGNLGALRTVNAGTVQEVRFIRAEAAAARFGGGFEGGVIEVVLRQ